MFGQLKIKVESTLVRIRFDATNVMWVTRIQTLHQCTNLGPELSSQGWRTFLALRFGGHLGKEVLHKLQAALCHGQHEITKEGIFVLLNEAFALVLYVACVVLNHKAGGIGLMRGRRWTGRWCACQRLATTTSGTCFRLLKMNIGAQILIHLTQESGISTFAQQGLFIEQCKDTYWFLLDEQHTLLVVEVVHILPSDSLLAILFLLSLQGEFNENLLQFLIHIVDAQLFKRILAKDLKAIDI
mmetsp:Transcript_40855/g.102868  ORF Transcript_40855/g.102868 Transcript_40855/m.102868 type:complete len:242 (+) Transcript_40855:1244-1969(+)